MRPPIVWQEPMVDWVAKLRGRRYFQGLRLWDGPRVQIAPAEGGELAVSRSTVFFQIMPVDKPDYLLVADVTADVLGLLSYPSRAMRLAYDAAMAPESKTYWQKPDILHGHVAALRSAKLIMTSWAEMVDPLFEFANCPVVHVPDYHGLWGRAFRRGMRQVWRELEATLELR